MDLATKEAFTAPEVKTGRRVPRHKTRDLDAAPRQTPRITALGGGHGLSVVLRGLRAQQTKPDLSRQKRIPDLTAIVTVADDGGNTGTLRSALNVQGLGDIRSSLIALSDGDPTVQALFNFRFDNKLSGHSLGNLMLAALTFLENDFGEAVERANHLLRVRGRVVPATTENVELLAHFDDGGMIRGESAITAAGRRIRRISLFPADVQASESAVAAISESDLVVIGPGSLYTSLIPNLLLKEIARAIIDSHAHVVLVMNLMAEPGETDGYSAEDIINALWEHVPDLPINTVLLNNALIPASNLNRYAARGIKPISVNLHQISATGCTPVSCKLLTRGKQISHDPRKLGRAILRLKTQSVDTTPALYTVDGRSSL
jgi:uncharacterized cofD-like protein